MVIELVEMTISTKYSGFDKLNHRFSYLLVSPFFILVILNLKIVSINKLFFFKHTPSLAGSLFA